MAVLALGVVPVLEPFLELAVLADLVRGELRPRRVSCSANARSTPRIAAASAVLANRSRINCWSIVGPATSPPCSGEFDGVLISQPVRDVLDQMSTKNSAAPFISG